MRRTLRARRREGESIDLCQGRVGHERSRGNGNPQRTARQLQDATRRGLLHGEWRLLRAATRHAKGMGVELLLSYALVRKRQRRWQEVCRGLLRAYAN